jgi:hypothetical protein
MAATRITYGQSVPRPSSVRGAGLDISGGWASRRQSGRKNPDGTAAPLHKMAKSKKTFTGTRAGIGRATGMQHVTVIRNGPGGPSRFPGAVLLPPRQGRRADQTVDFIPAPRPSLMTRIGRTLRSRFGRGV